MFASHRSLALPIQLLAAWSVLGVAGFAQAQDGSCQTDAECPKGYSCEVTGGGACPAPAPCADPEQCPEPPVCEPETFSSCVAVADGCSTDDDCDTGMVCYTETRETCSASSDQACAPGEECDSVPIDGQCETSTANYCIPRYVLGCETASDCGEGFECKPVEECSCSGSSGGAEPTPVPADGAGGAQGDSADTVPPEESCVCEPTDQSYCSIIEKPCSTDTECPSDWTCLSNPEQPVCASPDGAEVDCGTTEPESLCMPPYANTVIGVGRGGAVYASDAESADDSGIGTGTPAQPSTSSDGASGEDTSAGGGCSVGAAPAASGAAWMMLLGLGALVRRRRN